MSRYSSAELAQEHLLDVAKHVIHAINKCPQITGRTSIQSEVITGEDLVPIIDMLEVLGKTSNFINMDYQTFKINYDNGTPPVLLLIGGDLTYSDLNYNCGACGFNTCAQFNKYARENRAMGQIAYGPSCNWKILEYGMAMDWACAAAYMFNVDNRLLGSVGATASLLGYMPECSAIMGLPLGPAREMVWYSREIMNRQLSYQFYLRNMLSSIPHVWEGFPGSGKPPVKHSEKWWEDLQFINVEANPDLQINQMELFEALAQVVTKHNDSVAARYKK